MDVQEMRVKILDHTYELSFVTDDFNRNWGQSSPKEGWIKISNKCSASAKHSTILHEVVHIISDTLDAGLKEEENKVSALAIGIYSFIKNNPDLVKEMWEEA